MNIVNISENLFNEETSVNVVNPPVPIVLDQPSIPSVDQPSVDQPSAGFRSTGFGSAVVVEKKSKKANRIYPKELQIENIKDLLNYKFENTSKEACNALMPTGRIRNFILIVSENYDPSSLNNGNQSKKTRISKSTYSQIKTLLMYEINRILLAINNYNIANNKILFMLDDAQLLFPQVETEDDTIYNGKSIMRTKHFNELIKLLKIFNKIPKKILIAKQAIKYLLKQLNIFSIKQFKIILEAKNHARRITIFPRDISLKDSIFSLFPLNNNVNVLKKPKTVTPKRLKKTILNKKKDN